LLWQEPALDFLRDLELVRGTPLGFAPLRDPFCKPDAVERQPRLIADRRKQTAVFAGIRLFGEPRPEGEQPGNPLVAADHRREAFRSERVERAKSLDWLRVRTADDRTSFKSDFVEVRQVSRNLPQR
jgi:hypothetical protein